MKSFLPLKGTKHSALVVILCLSATFGFTKPGNNSSLPDANKLFNSPPVAGDDYAHLVVNTTITESYIHNDMDPDGDSLSINGMTINTAAAPILIETIYTDQGGIISFYTDGLYTYTPPVNYAGNDQVVYQVCDVTARPLCTTATIYFNIRSGNVLPLGISSFNGKKAGKDILLQWTTAQENNSDHFEIETGIDNNSFEKITSVNAKGFSNIPQQYSFIHRNSTAAINYYRLKMVDKDGKASYSKILVVRNDVAGIELAMLYPNPFSDKVQLVINNSRNEAVTIHIYDSKGMLLTTLNEQTVKGLNVITINNLGNLQPGSYFFEVTGTVNLIKAKLVKGM